MSKKYWVIELCETYSADSSTPFGRIIHQTDNWLEANKIKLQKIQELNEDDDAHFCDWEEEGITADNHVFVTHGNKEDAERTIKRKFNWYK